MKLTEDRFEKKVSIIAITSIDTDRGGKNAENKRRCDFRQLTWFRLDCVCFAISQVHPKARKRNLHEAGFRMGQASICWRRNIHRWQRLQPPQGLLGGCCTVRQQRFARGMGNTYTQSSKRRTSSTPISSSSGPKTGSRIEITLSGPYIRATKKNKDGRCKLKIVF